MRRLQLPDSWVNVSMRTSTVTCQLPANGSAPVAIQPWLEDIASIVRAPPSWGTAP